jgi:hypothetical protein
MDRVKELQKLVQLLVKAVFVNVVVLGEFLQKGRGLGAWCRTVRVGMTPQIQNWSEVYAAQAGFADVQAGAKVGFAVNQAAKAQTYVAAVLN